MKNLAPLKHLGFTYLRPVSMGIALAGSLLLNACGGGSTPPSTLPPEAVVVSVELKKEALELSDAIQTSLLEFLVTTDKPVLYDAGVVVSFNTSNAGVGPGYAAGGATCKDTVGVEKADYLSETKSQTVIKKGDSSVTIKIRVCPDADFEPNEVLDINWSSGSLTGTSKGTILNDDAGGLNSTGSTAVLPGLTAFGRDTHPLTNAAADGALGFSFATSGVCVFDKVSGLTWQNLPGVSKTYADLPTYVSQINASNLCGYSDWRLPTVGALLGLMDVGQVANSAANADKPVSSASMSGKFWSSDKLATSNPVDAWVADTDVNGVITFARMTNTNNVRLVRGGRVPTATCDNNDGRFTVNTGGTVMDTHTGLMWKTCPEGYTDAMCSAGTVLDINSAAAAVAQLKKANDASDKGYSDWRVPSRNELASLVNLSCRNPAIVQSVFPKNESLAYITSSVDVNAPTTRVWSVDFNDGNVGPDPLTRTYRLRLVRLGQ
jgi:hypothetical protein